MFHDCRVFLSVHCSLVVTCWERAELLAACDVLVCFCYFPKWCPESGGVVLDFIDS